MALRELSIDIETFSSENIKSGIHKYVSAPDFEIILFAWAFDNDPIQVVESTLLLPEEVISALTDKSIRKTAWNAIFEMLCIQKDTGIILDPHQWYCSMTQAMMLGLPASLDAAGRALNLDTTKDLAGKALIKYFCMPCKPTKTNGGRVRNYPQDSADKWYEFKKYNKIDVAQERKIKNKLSFFTPTSTERDVWALDYKINNKGILIDTKMANSALELASIHNSGIAKQIMDITKVDNPKSVSQLKGWLEDSIDEPIESLNKKILPKLKDQALNLNNNEAHQVLKLREELSKTSIKKYDAMLRVINEDGTVKGIAQYYGAARTGRWAGRLIQPQNLPRQSEDIFGKKLHLLDNARNLVINKDYDSINMGWPSVSDVLSQLIRTAIISRPGKSFAVSDFSAIEARVIAWLAGEKWRLDVFSTHGKIYEASAAMMFNVPIESVTKGSDIRFKGKCAELSLGFGGGPNALIRMGALEMGMTEEELPKIVRLWRNVNRKISGYWDKMYECAVEAILNPGHEIIHKQNNVSVSFKVAHNILWIKLPGGRHLTYYDPKLQEEGNFGKTYHITYLGVDQYTKRWERIRTYGGKITENIVQAIARDLLAESMLRLDRRRADILFHVHDEIIIEVKDESAASAVLTINKIMSMQPSWAKGLPLGAESFVTKYYKKD